MTTFPVSSDKGKQLSERMRALGVREQDIDEQFVRSSGAGGQNVNKVSSCVRRAKLRMLDDKQRQSEKKQGRASARRETYDG